VYRPREIGKYEDEKFAFKDLHGKASITRRQALPTRLQTCMSLVDTDPAADLASTVLSSL